MKFKHPSWSTLVNKNGHNIKQHPDLNGNIYRCVELHDSLKNFITAIWTDQHGVPLTPGLQPLPQQPTDATLSDPWC